MIIDAAREYYACDSSIGSTGTFDFLVDTYCGGSVGDDTGDVQTALCLLSLFHLPTVPTVPSIAEHLNDNDLERSTQKRKMVFLEKKKKLTNKIPSFFKQHSCARGGHALHTIYAFLIQPVLNIFC